MVRLLVTRSRAVLRPVSRAPVGCAGFRTSASSWAAASERSTGSGTQETPSTSPERDPWNAIVELATIQEPALPGSLHAWPITAKMNMCTETMQTTCGSRMLQGWVAGYDASAVALLKGAGAQLVGKTNCDEFGMGSENLHSVHGPVVSPWVGKDGAPRVAGGSSGGAAAAVAAGLCRVALGSDTGGSVRLPAAYCGVWGLKPSYGLISRFGLVSYVDSTDTIGIIARQVEDVASVLDVLDRQDENDPTSAPISLRTAVRDAETKRMEQLGLPPVDGAGPFSPPPQAPMDTIEERRVTEYDVVDLRGLRVGVPSAYFPTELSPAAAERVKSVAAALKARGAEIVAVDLPTTKEALSAYYLLACAEASSNLARYGAHTAQSLGFGPQAPDLAATLARIHEHTSPESIAELAGGDEFFYTNSQVRAALFGSEVRKRILLGTYALSAGRKDNFFLAAERVRDRVRADFTRVFSAADVRSPAPASGSSSKAASSASFSNSSGSSPTGVDLLLHPITVGTAPLLPLEHGGEPQPASSHPASEYTQDVFTAPASLAGLPSVAVPTGLAQDGLPLSVALTGQWGYERMLLAVARVVGGAFPAVSHTGPTGPAMMPAPTPLSPDARPPPGAVVEDEPQRKRLSSFRK